MLLSKTGVKEREERALRGGVIFDRAEKITGLKVLRPKPPNLMQTLYNRLKESLLHGVLSFTANSRFEQKLYNYRKLFHSHASDR